MSIEVCCSRYAEKFKAKINKNIFRYKKFIFFMIYLS